MIIRNAVRCRKCKKVLESTHRHDYRVCGCPADVMVDGGRDYLRRGWNSDMGSFHDLVEELSEEKEDDK